MAKEKPKKQEQWDPAKCAYRLALCKKEFEATNLKIENVKENVKENLEHHREEVERLLEVNFERLKLEVNSGNKNLKNKIIITEKSVGEKIDSLLEFNKTLRGDGDPGVLEKIRRMKWEIRIIFAIIFISSILVFGGNYKGVTLKKIKNFFSKPTEIKQVEKPPVAYILKNNEKEIVGPNHITDVEDCNYVE